MIASLRIKATGIAILALTGLASNAQEEEAGKPLEDGVVISLLDHEVIVYPDPVMPNSSPIDVVGSDWSIWYQKEIKRVNRLFLRLRFSKITPCTDCDFTVRVTGSNLDQRFYGPERFYGEDFWTELITGDIALVEVLASNRPEPLSFTIDTIVAEQEGQRYLSIVGSTDFEPIHNMEPEEMWMASSVAKLSYIANDRSKTCTGFLISENLLLTNEHCVNSDDLCDSAIARFGYKIDENGKETVGEQYQCIDHVSGQRDRDFAVLHLADSPGADSRWSVLRLCDRSLSAGDVLKLVQHPGGRPMEFVRNCSVVNPSVKGRRGVADETDLAHDCDTERGSSGSPVIDDHGDVVGLHHLGFGTGNFRDINRAVKISEILPLISIPPNCSGSS